MVEPLVVPRAQHTLSRRDFDPDALKVLYRLHNAEHVAYLVGGSVRDLLLGRRPKDFDIGTSAHPYQVKKLFRNCWIIGRRFRLAHIRFGSKVVEVATFRRQVPAGTEEEPPLPHDRPEEDAAPLEAEPEAGDEVGAEVEEPAAGGDDRDHLMHRDNTFGTPEEDAFRRDFTINALFYDIATFSVIDYVGGLDDLRASLICSIGDPNDRFLEDPVRMLRAIVLAARLDFAIDPPVLEAIERHRPEITKSAPARLLEEYFKILRSGRSVRAFRALGEARLLEHISPEVTTPLAPAVEASLTRLDAYRERFDTFPDALTTPILLGSLIVPLGMMAQERGRLDDEEDEAEEEAPPRRVAVRLGALPVARRDVERLAQILVLQRRLLDVGAPSRAQRSLVHRGVFPEALAWLDIHGEAPELVEHWQHIASLEASAPHGTHREEGGREHPRRPFPRRGPGPHRGEARGAEPHRGGPHRAEPHRGEPQRGGPHRGARPPGGPHHAGPGAPEQGPARRRRRRRRRRGGGGGNHGGGTPEA